MIVPCPPVSSSDDSRRPRGASSRRASQSSGSALSGCDRCDLRCRAERRGTAASLPSGDGCGNQSSRSSLVTCSGFPIVRAGAVRRYPPDVPTTAAVGVEVDPLAIARIVGPVVVRRIDGQSLLRAARGGHTIEVVLLAVPVGHEGQVFAVRRPAVEVARRGSRRPAATFDPSASAT